MYNTNLNCITSISYKTISYILKTTNRTVFTGLKIKINTSYTNNRYDLIVRIFLFFSILFVYICALVRLPISC
jgi:hypothetical protein